MDLTGTGSTQSFLAAAPVAAASRPAPMEWAPPAGAASDSQMAAFLRHLDGVEGVHLAGHEGLQAWALAHPAAFWAAFARWSADALGFSGPLEPAVVGTSVEHARFFPGVELNYAASLLNGEVAEGDAPALLHCAAGAGRQRWTRAQLLDEVERLAGALKAEGLGPGDRVVAVLRSDGRAVVAALAVLATGATLSTASADMGIDALADRFEPLGACLLIAHASALPGEDDPAFSAKLLALAARLPQLRMLLQLDDGPGVPGMPMRTAAFGELLARDTRLPLAAWPRLPFDHPLFVMFSSGTTGKPKCIVHGAGGSLIEHAKEHRLHTDLKRGDRLYFHTSCGWMMWNWQLSALASGVEIVTYDGGITDVGRLWALVDQEEVSVFGTSPAYLRMSEEAGLRPGRGMRMQRLRAVLSTGAVLHDRQFHWVAEQVKAVPVQSICGGTDIIGCFVLGHPMLPVRAGEAQCRSLGLDVHAWRDGRATEGIGELVCTNPFPSRPVGFFGDPDGSRFHAAYFARNAGVWTHGDLIEFTPHGGARLHGRADEVVNANGVKFAPAEVHRVLEELDGVRESLVTEQRRADGTRVVALLVLHEGRTLDSELVAQARRQVAARLSAWHVPDRFLQVPGLPITYSGKISDAAARRALAGEPVANAAALRNPEVLEAIRTAGAPAAPAAVEDPAPSSRTARVRAAWQRLLDLHDVGIDDDFFELGGTSLRAATLLQVLERSEGVRLPIGVMLQARTIRKLVEQIESDLWSRQPAVVVQLRSGTGNPVVLMPGITCTVLDFARLLPALGTRRPVVGIEWSAGLPVADPRERIQDVASRYAAQLQAQFPRAPLALCGYSFGGIVALEVARRLHAQGHPIETVIVLDTFVQPGFAMRCVRAARALAPSNGVPAIAAYVAGRVRDRSQKVGERLGWRPAARPSERSNVPPPLWPLYDYMFAGLRAYRPLPYGASPIVYIRASEDGFDLTSIWRGVARSGFELVESHGRHLDMVTRDAAAVARLIDARLRIA